VLPPEEGTGYQRQAGASPGTRACGYGWRSYRADAPHGPDNGEGVREARGPAPSRSPPDPQQLHRRGGRAPRYPNAARIRSKG
jgi:hypothetical protein